MTDTTLKLVADGNQQPKRGAMCANPFAGYARLDKCDLQGPSLLDGVLVDVASATQPERVLWTESIRDAAFNYLYYGLGRNGTSAQEFWHGAEFLLNVRASRPETWMNAPRELVNRYRDESTGCWTFERVTWTDAQIQAACLDRLWDCLSFPISLDEFCTRLQAKRRKIVGGSWPQIQNYVGLPGSLETWEPSLVRPTEPEQVEAILFYYNNNRRSKALQEAA